MAEAKDPGFAAVVVEFREVAGSTGTLCVETDWTRLFGRAPDRKPLVLSADGAVRLLSKTVAVEVHPLLPNGLTPPGHLALKLHGLQQANQMGPPVDLPALLILLFPADYFGNFGHGLVCFVGGVQEDRWAHQASLLAAKDARD